MSEEVRHKMQGSFDRGQFLKNAGNALLATTALSLPASSYVRVLGANDRVRLGRWAAATAAEDM